MNKLAKLNNEIMQAKSWNFGIASPFLMEVYFFWSAVKNVTPLISQVKIWKNNCIISVLTKDVAQF